MYLASFNMEETIMLKKIKNYIEYKKKIKLLKIIFVNQLTNLVINKNDYIVGFQKLLLTMASSEDASKLQEMLNNYVDTLKKNNEKAE